MCVSLGLQDQELIDGCFLIAWQKEQVHSYVHSLLYVCTYVAICIHVTCTYVAMHTYM